MSAKADWFWARGCKLRLIGYRWKMGRVENAHVGGVVGLAAVGLSVALLAAQKDGEDVDVNAVGEAVAAVLGVRVGGAGFDITACRSGGGGHGEGQSRDDLGELHVDGWVFAVARSKKLEKRWLVY